MPAALGENVVVQGALALARDALEQPRPTIHQPSFEAELFREISPHPCYLLNPDLRLSHRGMFHFAPAI